MEPDIVKELNIVDFLLGYVKEYYEDDCGYNDPGDTKFDDLDDEEKNSYILEFLDESDKCRLVKLYDYDLDEYTIYYKRVIRLEDRYFRAPDVYYPRGPGNGDGFEFDYKNDIVEMVAVPGTVYKEKK